MNSEYTQIRDIDFSKHVEFLGTAHFTKTSVKDVVRAVRESKPTALCIELDENRYKRLKNRCVYCSRRNDCFQKCEFIQATDVLGNQDADIWLIDMTDREIMHRIRSYVTPLEVRSWSRVLHQVATRQSYGVRLWEGGLKDKAMDYFQGNLEVMKQSFPSLYHVLITERNALMACRLILIISRYLDKYPEKDPNILVLTGAGHVDGINELLKRPSEAFALLRELNLELTPPAYIRRIKTL
ncbi:MAG: hypothetical protein ACFE7S_08760 [Candidatus Hodarchaeota archaeon]